MELLDDNVEKMQKNLLRTEVVIMLVITLATISITIIDDISEEYNNDIFLSQNNLSNLHSHVLSNELAVFRLSNAELNGIQNPTFTLSTNLGIGQQGRTFFEERSHEFSVLYNVEQININKKLSNPPRCIYFSCEVLKNWLVVIQLVGAFFVLSISSVLLKRR